MIPFVAVVEVVKVNGQRFVTGWLEGVARARLMHGGVIPGSTHPQGSVEKAASEAAVAFQVERRA